MVAPVTLAQLLDTLPQCGSLRWIGLRPERRATIRRVDQATLDTDSGLLGDRYAGRSGNRQVTLLQHEHLAVISSLLGRDVDPGSMRRNLVVSGINLRALKTKRFRIGDTVLECTGLCHPCSRMEQIFGPGGYNAVRGHGGVTARVLEGGAIARGDAVSIVSSTP